MATPRYVNIIKKRLPIIILLALLGAGSAYGFSRKQHKVYRATSSMLLNPNAPASGILFLSSVIAANGATPSLDTLATNYGVYFQSPGFDEAVVTGLHLQMTAAELGANTSSALVPGTNYFQISVTGNNPGQVAAAANGVAQTFIRQNTAPPVRSSGSTISTIDQRVITYYKDQLAGLRQQLGRLVADPHASLSRVTALTNAIKSVSDTYNTLLSTEAAGTSAPAQAPPTAILVNAATVPTAPISPNVTRNTLEGLLAGLLLGLALTYLLEFLDNTVRTPADVEELVGQAPLGILGRIGTGLPSTRRGPLGLSGRAPRPVSAAAAIPHANGNGANHSTALDELTPLTVAPPELVMLNRPEAPISEAFRGLRTNIEFSRRDAPLQSLVVTSPGAAEGKSTVAANLAIAMAQAGQFVILVDANLRHPSLAGLFGLKEAAGLTTVLLDREDRTRAIDEALQMTGVARLRVMTSGARTAHPAELLASREAGDVMCEIATQADLVIYDTPPIGSLTDAAILAARVDGTLLVIRANETRRDRVADSVNAIHKVGGAIAGAVLNRAVSKASSPYASQRINHPIGEAASAREVTRA